MARPPEQPPRSLLHPLTESHIQKELYEIVETINPEGIGLCRTIQEKLDFIRVAIKYMQFDQAAQAREITLLKKNQR